jgi:Rrf2 family protein
MKITTKSLYAMEAVVDLYINSTIEHESLINISERLDISENYLRQIFMNLKKKDIVKSIRGPSGGYYLGRDASTITAGEIIRAVEGDLEPVECLENKSCELLEECATRMLWMDLRDVINITSDEITIEYLGKLCS